MKNNVFAFLKRVASGVFFVTISAACVNHITESGELFWQNDIPLRIVAHILPSATTKVVNNAFEERDEVGLFALAGRANLSGERYVDNFRFVRSSTGEFVSADSVYYPADDIPLELISYYPYRPEGVVKGESKMPVTVAANQQEAAAYSRSDFLVATKQEVLPSSEPIPLTYRHKCFLLKFALTLDNEGEDIETLLALDPKIKLVGFHTKALYDFRWQRFSDFSEQQEMLPAGKWEIVDERLEGKTLILIPQEKVPESQYVLLEVGGKQYISFLPSSLLLESGMQRKLEISFVEAKEHLICGLKGEIEDWEGSETDKVASRLVKRAVDVRQVSFQLSNVYQVLSGRGQVAEICKEYLVTPSFAAQAIVVYPMTQQGTTDLTRGKVLQLLGREGHVHGGLVSWDSGKHTLEYTPGSLPPQHSFYVQTDGSISLTAVEDALPLWVQSHVVHDVREGEEISYPLVKVGSQYWLRRNLSTTVSVPEQGAFEAESAGYLRSFSGDHIYYTAAALSSALLPPRCSIPTWRDWDVLMNYLKQDASVLKGGDWLPATVGALVQPATGLSGFDALPAGMYTPTASPPNSYEGRYVGYWTVNDTGTALTDSVPLLRSNTNRLEKALTAKERKAFPIRCIYKNE